ncbi:short-chain dehydrogenase/reductase family 16C member 6 [Anabrus simplex]|uniref:short-chain dehydrogenase/reductase family 16C member 6 n=1 Tax=Anabrus simplex TaxID=316456 RepID=UPI0035A2FA63
MTWLQLLILIGEVVLGCLRCAFILLKCLLNKLFPPEEKNLQGEVVLVTGAGQGLGRELAWRFAHEGCVVICVDVNASTNSATVDRLLQEGFHARGYAYDVSDRCQVQELAERVLQDVERVDILVNNAAILHTFNAPGKDITQRVESFFRINTLSHFWTTQAFLPGMLERDHGHIVAISSMAALIGLGSAVSYSSSKSAISGMMMSLSEELRISGHQNIKTTCVFPYLISTPLQSCFKTFKLPPMSVEYAAEEIIQGMKHEVQWFVLPHYMGPLVNFLRMLPKEMSDIFRKILIPISSISPYELFDCATYAKK